MFLLLSFIILIQQETILSNDFQIIEKVIISAIESYESFFKTSIEEVVIVEKGVKCEFFYSKETRDLLVFHFGGQSVDSLIKADSVWEQLLLAYSYVDTMGGKKTNLSKSELSTNLKLANKKVFIISPYDQKRVFKRRNGWQRFYRKYPKSNGIYELSKPLIINNKAIIYLGNTLGNLNGSGQLIFLELGREITIAAKMEIWVS